MCLPVTVTQYPNIAMGLSLFIAVMVLFDIIFNPKRKTIVTSKATQALEIIGAKMRGDYEKYEDIYNTILRYDELESETMVDLNVLLSQFKNK